MWRIEDLNEPVVMVEVLACLRPKLRRRCSHLDEHLIDGSIEDALLRLLACPKRYDASRGLSLPSYLELLSRSYLYKCRLKESCHQRHEKAAGVSERDFEIFLTETQSEEGIYIGRDRVEAEKEAETLEWEREVLELLVARLNGRDRTGAELLRTGASFEEWSQHLSIEHLPIEEQHSKVNAERARLKRKLKRWAQKMQGGRSRATGGECESWLMQRRMWCTQQVDGTREGKHSRALCLPPSAYYCS